MRRFALLVIFLVGNATASPNPWATLQGCSYLPHRNNDGDSFHVRCGDDAFVREALKGPFTVVTRNASAGGRGKELRYYGMVQVGGRNLDEILVLAGLARAKGVGAAVPGEKSRTHAERLRILEDEAKQKRRGLWAAKK